jgi:hypothetical protein
MNVLILDGDCKPPDWARELGQAIDSLTEEINRMNEVLDTLVSRVAAVESVGDSAILLLQELKTALDSAISASDWAAVSDINARLQAQTEELANAVAAYTPAAAPTE